MEARLPRRFNVCDAGFSKKEAQDALIATGAIILTNLDPTTTGWSDVASLVPTHVWDANELLLQRHRADSVNQEHAALKLEGEALLPHSDGYKWGDCFPDLVILVCEEPAVGQTGANYLVDGKAILDRLTNTTKYILMEELVDHTERNDNSFTQGAESVAPVFRFLIPKGWRQQGDASSYLCWRRMMTKDASQVKATAIARGEAMPYISLWAPMDNATESNRRAIQQALYELDQAIETEAALAPRFVLQKGEALIVDNFRMLHAREAFHGSENKRQMWRVWSWTNGAFGLPPEIKPSGEGVPSTILGSVSPI